MARHAAVHKHIHKKQPKSALDYLVYFFVVATPLFELPQAYAIYSSHSAENVSTTTWVFFFISTFVLAAYAIKNRLTPLIITYSLYCITEGAIVVGIILYS